MASGFACATELMKASTVWPDSVLPLASVIVPEIIKGTRTPSWSNACSMANIPALAFSGLLCVYIFKCTVIFWSIHADLFGKVFVVVPGIISLLFWYYWRRIVTLLVYVLSVASG